MGRQQSCLQVSRAKLGTESRRCQKVRSAPFPFFWVACEDSLRLGVRPATFQCEKLLPAFTALISAGAMHRLAQCTSILGMDPLPTDTFQKCQTVKMANADLRLTLRRRHLRLYVRQFDFLPIVGTSRCLPKSRASGLGGRGTGDESAYATVLHLLVRNEKNRRSMIARLPFHWKLETLPRILAVRRDPKQEALFPFTLPNS